MNEKFKIILNWVIRNGILLVCAFAAIFAIWSYFGNFLSDILFAIGVAIFAELIAIFLSNLAAYLYTNYSFVKGIIYGQNQKLDYSEQKEYIKVLGSIFLGVHVLVAIVISMLFWGKLGA